MFNALSWAKNTARGVRFLLGLICTCFWLNVNRYTYFWHLPKMKCLNELQIRGQAFRDDWCEVEPIYCCFFSRRISELASSLEAEQIRKLPISHPILTSSPVTAALQNCESSASRLAVPSRLQRSLLSINSRTI